MTPEYENPKRQQAHTLYVLRGHQPGDICAIVEVSEPELMHWVDADDWVKRRQDHLVVMRDTAAAEMGMAVAAQTGTLVSKYLGIQSKLLDKLDTALEEAVTPHSLNTLSKAISSNFSVYDDLLSSAKVTDKTLKQDDSAPPATMVQVNILHSAAKAVKEAKLVSLKEDIVDQ